MYQRLVRWVVPGGIHYPESHRRLRLFWVDGVLWNVGESFVLAFSTLYALVLGATTAQVGQLTAVSNLLGALALIPGARVSEAWGQRKRLVLIFSGVGARLPLLLLAVVPFVFKGVSAVYAVMALLALRTFCDNFAKPAATSLTADFVPLKLRGRYFSSRNFAMGVVALLTVPLAGFLIRGLGEQSGYQVGFFICFVAAALSAVAYSMIQEPPPAPSVPRLGARELVTQMLAQRPFVAFTVTAFLWSLALSMAGPFFNVFMVRDLGMNAASIGLVTATTNFTSLIGQRWWGMQYSKLGDMGIFRITGLVIPILPFFWTIAFSPWHVGVINFVGGLAWSGYTLATFNLLLSLTPDQGRERYVAVYQTSVFLAACVAPLLGAWLSDLLGFRLLFALSGAGRLLATVLFFRLIAQRSSGRERRQSAAHSSH